MRQCLMSLLVNKVDVSSSRLRKLCCFLFPRDRMFRMFYSDQRYVVEAKVFSLLHCMGWQVKKLKRSTFQVLFCKKYTENNLNSRA